MLLLIENGTVAFELFPQPFVSPKCISEWLGDGICDEFNNNADCGFDTDDCCKNENMIALNCADCSCKNPDHEYYQGSFYLIRN